MATGEYRERTDPLTLKAPIESREYLNNRIWKTLVDGIAIGRQIAQEEIAERFARFIKGA